METPVMEKSGSETARKIARALSVSLFERVGYDAKAMAQRNLAGKSHYVDDDTLKFFHARIVQCRAESSGLLLALVESKAADHRNTSRGFAFVVFDLFGNVLSDRGGDLFKTSDKAGAAAAEFLAGFDVLAHYRRALAERAERLEREAGAMRTCADTL